jgi:hypothetical protein
MATSVVLAEFPTEAGLCSAARELRDRGYTRIDAHSPYPLHEVDAALGLRRSPVPLIALVFGLTGAISGYVMQWWMNGVNFPINVGNRPPHSPPTNIPITFELGVLFAALAIVIGLFVLCGFPRTYHPVFEAEPFRTASVDALWLSAEVDPDQAEPLSRELEALGARRISRVPEEAR